MHFVCQHRRRCRSGQVFCRALASAEPFWRPALRGRDVSAITQAALRTLCRTFG
jgi:hypothetical protein